MDVVNVFRKVWKAADELAEKETVQFEKLPYEKKEIVELEGSEEGVTKCEYKKISRTEYKDNKRQEHILEMMELLVGSKDENGV